MSDATGFGTGGLGMPVHFNSFSLISFISSGGTSALLTVADPLPGASCDITVPNTPFDFQINDALQQCRAFSFTGYDVATQPVTIYGQSRSLVIVTPPARATRSLFLLFP